MVTLNYKYRLYPTSDQQKALARSMFFVWRGWNMMCRFERQARVKIQGQWSKEAQRKVGGGRAQEVRRELAKWVSMKEPTGQRVTKLRSIAKEKGLDETQALRLLSSKDIRQAWSKKRSGLSVEYAIHRADRVRSGMASGHLGKAWGQLKNKYETAWKNCWKGTHRAPRKKPPQQATWIQAQIQKKQVLKNDNPQGAFQENWVSVSTMLPERQRNEALKWVKIIQHRPLPAGATIKQLIITRSSTRPDAEWFAVLSVDLPDEVGQIDYPATRRSCGIDPGRKTALTIVSDDVANPGEDGYEQDPGAPYRRVMKKVRRLQRELDRRKRANNPDCFSEDGTWKKGRRCKITSQGMLETQRKIARTLNRTKNIRKEHYHGVSNQLLREHDTVFLEAWKDPSPKARGRRKAVRKEAFALTGERRKKGAAQLERVQSRADRDNALGVFRQLLTEKAKRSKTPKRVEIVPAANTTRRCVHCQELTGPTGVAGLRVRGRWTCSSCGKSQMRDRGAAWNILQAGLQAEAQSVKGGPQKPL